MSAMSNAAIICHEAYEGMADHFSYLMAVEHVALDLDITWDDASSLFDSYVDTLEA